MRGDPEDEALYFDDVAEGRHFVSLPRIVTEADLLSFTEVSGDRHPIHTDDRFARTTVFGQRILQGPFGIAIAIGLFGQFTQFTKSAIALTDIGEWKFRAPVMIDDELTLHMTIEGKRRLSSGDRGIVQRRMVLQNQAGQSVQSGIMGLMMWCNAPGSLAQRTSEK
jgi:acyl dehydratase